MSVKVCPNNQQVTSSFHQMCICVYPSVHTRIRQSVYIPRLLLHFVEIKLCSISPASNLDFKVHWPVPRQALWVSPAADASEWVCVMQAWLHVSSPSSLACCLACWAPAVSPSNLKGGMLAWLWEANDVLCCLKSSTWTVYSTYRPQTGVSVVH